jgi:hypothetical protein
MLQLFFEIKGGVLTYAQDCAKSILSHVLFYLLIQTIFNKKQGG